MTEKTMTPKDAAAAVAEKQPDQLIIDVRTAEELVNYLAHRPYVEVFQLIAAMQQLQPLLAPAAKETAK